MRSQEIKLIVNAKNISDFYSELNQIKKLYGFRERLGWFSVRLEKKYSSFHNPIIGKLWREISNILGGGIGVTRRGWYFWKGGGKDFIDGVLLHEENYKKLYDTLSDEKSKNVLLAILKYRITGDTSNILFERDYLSNQYFDVEIIKFADNEVFVDCGGWIGDTTEMFIKRAPNFSKIYFYEPEPENYKLASHYLSRLGSSKINNIIFRESGVGKENIMNKITSNGGASSISSDGGYSVNIVSIDQDIKDDISFIKMDIEGYELDALLGAKSHIITDHPKLAISVYHNPDALWDIPELLLNLNSSYKLYLRHYTDYNDDTVLYAI